MKARGFVPVVHAARPDRPDEADTVTTAGAVAAALTRQGWESPVIDLGADFAPALQRLAARAPAAVVNMVETVAGDPLRAAEPARVMQALGLHFTGCTAEALEAALIKTHAKRRLRAAGLPTPDWWRAGDAVPPERRVIVKSDSEHGSLGIDAGSIVAGARAVEEIAARAARFGGAFFAETFIEGREFNVALLEAGEGGARVLPIPEILFETLPEGAPHIVDYGAKWDPACPAYHHTPRRFGIEAREPALAAELARLSRAVWDLFGLSGYARVDFRVDAAGAPWVLEVNTNPCLAPDAGFAAAAAQAGITYDALVAHLLAVARARPRKAA
ncbi:MAG: D-alanine--D-alanine ligase [Paracoccaceae bacterium]|nr:MAG: D-alanine--D-alanine ligase [Paracoccaceae bacterium]